MSEKRFEVIDKHGKLEQFSVIRDDQTGVLYLSHIVGLADGLTVMVDPQGKPLIDEEYNK